MANKCNDSHKKKNSEHQAIKFIFGAVVFSVPICVYLLVTVFIFPVPNSGFIIMGVVGTCALGLGAVLLFNIIVSKKSRKESRLYILPSVPFLIGFILIMISSVILYLPHLYAKFDSAFVDYYFLLWSFFVIPAAVYPFIRMFLTQSLRNKGYSKTIIKKNTTGFKNFWFYDKINEFYDLGAIYTLNRAYLYAFSAGLFLHIILGWWKPVCVISAMSLCFTFLTGAILWLLTAFRWRKSVSNFSEGKKSQRYAEGIVIPLFGAVFLFMCIYPLIVYIPKVL